MSLAPNYSFAPRRARAGMAYGQYNQITTFSTTADGVTPGAVVSYDSGAVSNGGAVPAGIVVDSQSMLGLGFDDQYKTSCCAVLEQGKAWALTKAGETFSINDPVAYDTDTGELDSAGTVVTGWIVVGGTVEDPDGTTRTLVQVLPTRQTSAPEVAAPEAESATKATVQQQENTSSITETETSLATAKASKK